MAQEGCVRRSTFQYCNMWALSPSFYYIVSNVWAAPVFGDKMHRVMYKLKKLKKPLLMLNRQQFPVVVQQLEEARNAFTLAQENLGANKWNQELVDKEQHALQHYQYISKAAHLFMVQQSKATWLQLGDDNTRYFHSLMRKQRYHMKISMIQYLEGDLLTDQVDIQRHFY